MIPGFALQQNCRQERRFHCEGDVATHVGWVLSHAAQTAGLGDSEFRVLIAAVLLHVVCKPDTFKEQGNRITFYGHAEQAAKRCPDLGPRLGLTEVETEALVWVVGEHMLSHEMRKFSEQKRLEYYQHRAWPVLQTLQRADALASWRNEDGTVHGEVLSDCFEQDRPRLIAEAARKNRNGALKGQATRALQALQVRPGAYFGKVTAAALKVFSGAMPSEDQVAACVREFLRANPPQ